MPEIFRGTTEDDIFLFTEGIESAHGSTGYDIAVIPGNTSDYEYGAYYPEVGKAVIGVDEDKFFYLSDIEEIVFQDKIHNLSGLSSRYGIVNNNELLTHSSFARSFSGEYQTIPESFESDGIYNTVVFSDFGQTSFAGSPDTYDSVLTSALDPNVLEHTFNAQGILGNTTGVFADEVIGLSAGYKINEHGDVVKLARVDLLDNLYILPPPPIVEGEPRDIIGTAYDDVLYGNSKNNRIDGRDGDDLIDGGIGRNLVKGGNGADIFVARAGKTKVLDFDNSDGDTIAVAFGSNFDLSQRRTGTILVVDDGSRMLLRNALSDEVMASIVEFSA